MPEEKILSIANNADMIVKGYAFKKQSNGFISILNLGNPCSAMVISGDGQLIETNMDEIEQAIVLNCWKRNSCFMEAAYA